MPNFNQNIVEEIIRGMEDMKFTKLDEQEWSIPQVNPTNPVCMAIDVVKNLMKAKAISLHQRMIYKKVPDSKYTSIMCCTVKYFLITSLQNVFKDSCYIFN